MKKILIITFVLATLVCCFSLTAFAAETEPTLNESGGVFAENDAGEDESGVLLEENETDGNGGTTVFAEAYELVISHSDKILSALAFVCSLILALLYRKGVLPLIKGGLNTIGATVDMLKEETEKASAVSESIVLAAKTKFEEAERTLTELSEKLVILEDELISVRDGESKINDVKLVLKSQTDLLYEIFMSSSIPMYLKESVGEKIGAMRKKLDAEEVSRDD